MESITLDSPMVEAADSKPAQCEFESHSSDCGRSSMVRVPDCDSGYSGSTPDDHLNDV